jgi:hypothetical protein
VSRTQVYIYYDIKFSWWDICLTYVYGTVTLYTHQDVMVATLTCVCDLVCVRACVLKLAELEVSVLPVKILNEYKKS